MGLHDLGDHFILLGQLLLESGELPFEPSLLGLAVALEGGGAVFEQLLLPAIEEVGIQTVLIAQVGDGHALQQVTPEDVELLLRREVSSCGHGHLPGSVNILTGDPEMSISV